MPEIFLQGSWRPASEGSRAQSQQAMSLMIRWWGNFWCDIGRSVRTLPWKNSWLEPAQSISPICGSATQTKDIPMEWRCGPTPTQRSLHWSQSSVFRKASWPASQSRKGLWERTMGWSPFQWTPTGFLSEQSLLGISTARRIHLALHLFIFRTTISTSFSEAGRDKLGISKHEHHKQTSTSLRARSAKNIQEVSRDLELFQQSCKENFLLILKKL